MVKSPHYRHELKYDISFAEYAERITAGIMAAALIACLIIPAVTGSSAAADAGSILVEYERQLFDTDKPMSIDILLRYEAEGQQFRILQVYLRSEFRKLPYNNSNG